MRTRIRWLAIAIAAGACGGRGGDAGGDGESGTTTGGGIDLTMSGSGPKLDLADTGMGEGPMEADTGCDSELFGSEAVPPNVLIVLDRSNSMETEIDGASKWDIAIEAIGTVTAQHENDARFGLMLFPGLDEPCDDGAECTAGAVFVDPAAMTKPAIDGVLGTASTCMFGTPIAENLDSLVDYAGLEDTERANYVLLVTDGMATCADPVPSVTALREQDPEIKTFVVGFGGDVDPAQLTAMAVEGGTALPGDPAYYQADDAEALGDAFADIAGTVLSCVFELAEVPSDPNDLYAFFDDLLVDRDPMHMDGWDYDPATNTVTFYGPACDSIQAAEVQTVNIVFGCPMLPPQG